MTEIDEGKLEKALSSSGLIGFYYKALIRNGERILSEEDLGHKWAGHVAEAYRDLYAVERSISPMDEDSVEEALAKLALRVEPPKIEGGSEARRNWLTLIMDMQLFVMRAGFSSDAFKEALLGVPDEI